MKNYPNMRFLVLAFAAMSIFAVSCSDDNAVNNPAPVPNIAQIIAQSPNLSTLNAALVKANLTGALTSGTLTVFAPDNAAFAAAGITDINAVPVTKLDSILKYHVLGQIVGSSIFPGFRHSKKYSWQKYLWIKKCKWCFYQWNYYKAG